MEIQATARYIRQSPRKVRLVVNLIKGLSVEAAEDQLIHLPKRASATVLKLLKSAMANAKHNNKIEASNLYVARAFVDQGPTMKRTTAKAFGKAAIIRKRMSHITVVLAEKVIKAEK
ncbi:MAG: 50S ribosomal protein L22 [Patescibacteria group bacterium]